MRRFYELALLFLVVGLISADYEKGNGIFGKWTIDRYGLVAYQYQLDQLNDDRALWQRGNKPSRLHWHQIGNPHINAIATNYGYVQLFYNDSAQRWLNFYQPEKLKFSGGFGFILDGDTAFSSFYPLLPSGREEKRIFGTGYFEKELTYSKLLWREIIFAPMKDSSALIMRVQLKNLSSQKKNLTYLAYFDVHPLDLSAFSTPSFQKLTNPNHKFKLKLFPEQSLIIAQSKKLWAENGGYPDKPMKKDPELPDLFLASLELPSKGAIIDPKKLFKKDGWLGAKAFKNLTWQAPREAFLPAEKICLGLAMELELKPGEEKTFHLAYGYAKAKKVEEVLKELSQPDGLFQDTLKFWKETSPTLILEKDQYLEREIKWADYYLSSSFLYDPYYDRHFAPQGGNYLYLSGVNGAMRDFSAYIQALSYYRPEMAREMLELCLKNQESSGRLFYDFEGYGSRYLAPYRPSDLSLWLLWATIEYIFATRDFAFLQKELPYYPKEKGESGTVLEHLIRAYDHLEKNVGTGRNGLIQLKMSDWNDEMTFLVTRADPIDFLFTYFDGESLLNTAMACYLLPQFAELLKSANQVEKADQVLNFYSQLKSALQKHWLGSGWFPRAYSALGKTLGKKNIYLEPQVWALLCPDLLSQEQKKILIQNLDQKLKNPSQLGMMISSATTGSLTTRSGEQEKGGIWFAINGPASLVLAQFDPELGYDELKRNSLAWHAEQYPELWFGIWSGPDAFNSIFSKRPGQTWYMNFPTKIGPQFWPIQNNHPHSQLLWAIAKLAGFEPTREGYIINPLLPMERYKLETPSLGIEKQPGKISGYFKFNSSGTMLVQVKLQNAETPTAVRIDGKKTEFKREDQEMSFYLPFQQGRKVDWELTLTR